VNSPLTSFSAEVLFALASSSNLVISPCVLLIRLLISFSDMISRSLFTLKTIYIETLTFNLKIRTLNFEFQ